jgi:hypothetical protein
VDIADRHVGEPPILVHRLLLIACLAASLSRLIVVDRQCAILTYFVHRFEGGF